MNIKSDLESNPPGLIPPVQRVAQATMGLDPMEQQRALVLQLRELRKQMCQMRDGLAKANNQQLDDLEDQIRLCLENITKVRKILEDLPIEDPT